MLPRPDLSHLSQGDVLADLYVVWLPEPDFYVVSMNEQDRPVRWQRLSENGQALFAADSTQWCCVLGRQTPVMLMSQTCDIVQATKPTVLLAPVRPLAELPGTQTMHGRANRLPWAFYLPATEDSPEQFADLRFLCSVDKWTLTGGRKIRSLTPSLATKLTQVLAAWFTRPALPDEVVQALRPFVEQVKGWSRASQDQIYGFYLCQDGPQLHLLAVMNERDEALEKRVRQAVEKAARQAPAFVIDLTFEALTTTPLARLQGFLLLDLGYLSYPG